MSDTPSNPNSELYPCKCDLGRIEHDIACPWDLKRSLTAVREQLAASEARLKEMTEIARELDKYSNHIGWSNAGSFDGGRAIGPCNKIPCRCGYKEILVRLEKAESTTEVKRDVYAASGKFIVKNGRNFSQAWTSKSARIIADELNRIAGGEK